MSKITKSSGNVFADLGFKDAENLLLRAQLAIEIKQYIKKHLLTQAQAAAAMGTTQPRINDILRGRLERVTIDRLVNMLAAVGRHVSMRVGKAA